MHAKVRFDCTTHGLHALMQLTRHTDYALRLLIHLARSGQERIQIAEVARLHGISHAHLMKVANHLAHLGFIDTVRGRGGGVRLARPAEEINLAAVVRGTEPDRPLVECGACGIGGNCGLPTIFAESVEAFLGSLGRYSLGDLARNPGKNLNPMG